MIALTTVIVLSLGALTAALVSLAGSSGTGGTVAVTRTVTAPAAGDSDDARRRHDTRHNHDARRNHNTRHSHNAKRNHNTRRSDGSRGYNDWRCPGRAPRRTTAPGASTAARAGENGGHHDRARVRRRQASVQATRGGVDLEVDVAVVGAGAAGLYAALCAAREGARVALVSAAPLAQTASYWAQGGLAAALAEDDSPELHLRDTERAGRGAMRTAAAEVLVKEAPECVADLQALGVRFDADRFGRLALGLEGGHSVRRVVHAGGSATGRRLLRALAALAVEEPRIAVLENVRARGAVAAGNEPLRAGWCARTGARSPRARSC